MGPLEVELAAGNADIGLLVEPGPGDAPVEPLVEQADTPLRLRPIPAVRRRRSTLVVRRAKGLWLRIQSEAVRRGTGRLWSAVAVIVGKVPGGGGRGSGVDDEHR